MKVRLRIAFDIGSGATKVCGAIVREHVNTQSSTSSIESVLVEREQVMLIGQAVKYESHDGKTIPEKTIGELKHCVQGMLHQVQVAFEQWKKAHSSSEIVFLPEQRVGISTAIFRVASNGSEVLNALGREPFRMPCSILSQDDEAALGYETAKQYMLTNPNISEDVKNDIVSSLHGGESRDNKKAPRRHVRLVSYDSGAASFQLCVQEAINATAAFPNAPSCLRYFNGQWGSTIAHLALLKVVKEVGRGTTKDGATVTVTDELDPNPVGKAAAIAFHKLVLADLEDETKHPLESREYFRSLFSASETGHSCQIGPDSIESIVNNSQTPQTLVFLQAFGGNTSAFNMCSKVFKGASYIDRRALWDKIITDYCYKTNEELVALDFVQPEVLVAKLLLVYSVMTHLGIDGIHFQMAVGNTRAIVGTDRFWSQQQISDRADSPISKM